MGDKCPVCYSTNTLISNKGYSSRKNAGFNYLRGVKSLKNSDFEKIEEIIPLYYCLDCKTGWRGNTELSKEIDRIYHTKHSLHWKSYKLFCEFIRGDTQNIHLISFSKLIIHFSNFLNKKINIIEIGSPILGIGFLNADQKLLKNITCITRNVNGLDSILIFHEKLTYFSIKIYQFLNHLKSFLKKLIKKNKKQDSNKKNFIDLNKKIKKIEFCNIPTSVGWGTSSIIFGQSSLKWLLTLNPRIDLINGYFKRETKSELTLCVNYIDHFDSPIEIIKDMLCLSECILFNIHKNNDAGIQHKYTYSDTFNEVVNKSLNEEYLCLNISNTILKLDDQNKYNYFIVGDKNSILEFRNYLENIK